MSIKAPAVESEVKDTTEVKEPKRKKSSKKDVPVGLAFIQSSFNNTIKGARKSTPFAAQIAAEDAARIAADQGMRSLSVFVNGPGGGRESALRGLQVSGIKVTFIRDVTPIPHNGCRPSKRRRI